MMQVATSTACDSDGELNKQNGLVPTNGASDDASLAMATSAATTTAAATTAAAAHNLLGLSALAAFQPNFATHLTAGVSLTPQRMSPSGEVMAPMECEAKLIDYRGNRIAGFEMDGEMLVCLPQTYELFLKNLVGGLHTVYTKLKRLDITPRVCNVEQVRALRSLGAIQPGVNRCKLITCKDFDALYDDCTSTNSSRPGRPPKRSSVSGGGAECWPINLTKKCKTEPFDAKQSVAAMNLLNPQTTAVQNFMPFLPLAQQLLMQQMMTAALGGGGGPSPSMNAHTAGLGAETAHSPNGDDNHYDDDDEDRHTDTLKIDESNNGCQNTAVNCNQNAQHGNPLNLKMKADKSPINVLSGGDGVGGDEGGKATQQTTDFSEDDEPADDGHNAPGGVAANVFLPSGGGVADMTNWLGMMQSLNAAGHVPASTADAAGGKMTGPPLPPTATTSSLGLNVCGLLQNVVGLIEIAQTTARVQEQQHAKENGDITTALNHLQAENKSLDSRLKEERRIKKIYLKRWKKASQAKSEIQNQLLNLLETQQQRNGNQLVMSPLSEVHQKNVHP